MTACPPQRIVFASHTQPGGDFVVGSHQLAREMSIAGLRVGHISTPVTPFHVAFRGDRNVRQRYNLWRRPSVDRSGVLSMVPMALFPWPVSARFPPLWRQYAFISYRRMRRLLHEHLQGEVDLLIIDQPKLVGLIGALGAGKVIYRPTDLYARMPGNSSIQGAESLVIERADAVVATSQPIAHHIATVNPSKSIIILPNGVDVQHFSAPAALPAEYVDAARIRAVYVGALDERFDFSTVRRLAQAFPEVSFFVIGPGSPRAERLAEECDNVRVLGSRLYASLPGYLQHADVALLPLNDHPANAGRSPMKLYEYAAAGLPVLARHTAEIARCKESFISTYTDDLEAVDNFRRLVGERIRFAMPKEQIWEHSWKEIARTVLEVACGET
jgi:glycosyltransferase involved in cell wall biosynthesis